MKLKNLVCMAVAMPMLFAACKRDVSFDSKNPNGTLNVTDPNKLAIPANFNFETHKDLTVKVGVANVTRPGEKFRINIYIDLPSTGKLTTSGITNEKYEYTADVRVAADLDFIYIEKVDERGTKVVEKVATSKYITKLFKNGGPEPIIFRKAHSGLDCNSGCNTTYNNHSGDVTVLSGIACFTGTHPTGKIVVENGAVAKICATGYIDTIVLNGSGRAYILDNALLTIGKVVSNSSSTEFYNWSDSTIINGCFTINGIAENHGKLYSGCTFDITTTGTFSNFGSLYTAHNLIVNNVFENYHQVTINGSITVGSTGTLSNYCTITSKDNATISGTMHSGPVSYYKVVRDLTITSSGVLKLDNNTLVSAKNLIVFGTIEGTGSNTNIVKVAEVTTINGGALIKGNTDVCDGNGIETNSGTFQSPAQAACNGFIPTGSCNTEGFGSYVPSDVDADGVPDLLDDYPNDASKAFNQFYPCATTCSNLVFEDLWPSQGDFDFNDLVVAYNVQKIYNAQNNVVGYNVKAKPRAVGAGYKNAFGFSLDQLVPSDVFSVVGQHMTNNGLVSLAANGTENGQSMAVIIAYDSPEPLLHRAGGSMFNTIKANPFGGSDTAFIRVTFSRPIDDSKVDFAHFNPFIIAKQTRGVEIHLPDRLPTDKANPALFGTIADRSNPGLGRYYKAANGMPWVLDIHENFDYPIEKASVLNAYQYFDDWATSGGSVYPNWFRGFGGYRNPELIY